MAKKGKVVLGTVFQDVHSIGKDLVKTLLENWGWEVVDLGSQVESGKFVEAAKKHKPFAIGMSALLVQTSNHMLTVAKMLEEENIRVPILIGGASVNWEFASKIASVGMGGMKEDVFYCKTAMEGVKYLESLFSDRGKTVASNREKLSSFMKGAKVKKPDKEVPVKGYSYRPSTTAAPFVKTLRVPVEEIKINYRLLFNLNWKFGKEKTKAELEKLSEEWLEKSLKNGWIEPAGIVGLFPCNGDGGEIIVYSADKKKEIARIKTKIARFFASHDLGFDAVGLQLATAGARTDSVTAEFERKGDFFSAHIFQGLANRLAEDTAEFLHGFLREKAGVSEKSGIRVSPGYPAIKDMENNRTIYEILKGEKIGVELTEAFGFKPLATTSAVVCFNPEATYRV